MATKKIQIEFDLNTNEVKLAGEATLSLAQQVRILQKELQKTPEGTKEFELLRRKLNDTKDNFDRVNAKSRELFGTLSLLPGPVGEIAGKLNGAISLFKTFSGFSLKDLRGQFTGLVEDLKGVLNALGGWATTTKDTSQNLTNLNDTTQQLDNSVNNLNTATGALVSQQQQGFKTIQEYNKALADEKKFIGDTGRSVQQLSEEQLKNIPITARNAKVHGTLTGELNKQEQQVSQNRIALEQQTKATNQTTQSTENLDKKTKESTKSLGFAANATRLFAGALTAIGIGIFIGVLSSLITKLYDYVTGASAAKRATEQFNDALQEQNYWLEYNANETKRNVDVKIAQMKAEGKSAKEIRDFELQEAIRFYLQQKKIRDDAFAQEQAAVKGNNVEIMDAAIADYRKKEQTFQEAEANLLKIRARNQEEEKKEIEDGNKEKEKKQKEANDKATQLEADRLTERKAQLDAAIQLEINSENTRKDVLEKLLKERLDLEKLTGDRLLLAIQENQKKVTEALTDDYEKKRQMQLDAAEAAIQIEESQAEVNTEKLIQLLAKRRDIELKEEGLTAQQKLAIQEKYEADFRKLRQDAREKQLVEDIQASEGNFEKQIELYRQYADEITKSRTYTEAEKLRIIQETNDKILSLEQQRFDNEKTKLELKREQDRLTNTEYYDELDALYVKELERAKQQKDQLIINEAEYNKRVKELSDARNNIRQAEFDAEIATFQAIGQGLGAVSQLIGENTKQGKAFAVAATLVNTYAAIAAQLRTAAGSPGGAIPGYAIAQAIATGLVGFAQVKKILSTQIPASTPSNTSNIGTGAINVNQRRAQGGMIFGAGSDSSDSIPAMLSNGEFVVNARSTRVFRPLLESMNSAANLPQFAVGGLVSGPGMTPPQSQNETIADAISSAFGQTPIRTYVTANDVSTQQQFDRIIKSRSLI